MHGAEAHTPPSSPDTLAKVPPCVGSRALLRRLGSLRLISSGSFQHLPSTSSCTFSVFHLLIVNTAVSFHRKLWGGGVMDYCAHFPGGNIEATGLPLGPSEPRQDSSPLVHSHPGNRVTCSSWHFQSPPWLHSWRGKELQGALLGTIQFKDAFPEGSPRGRYSCQRFGVMKAALFSKLLKLSICSTSWLPDLA